MLDMLGEDARAAVGKVKQLQSQGATPDQIDAQLIDAARNGLLPISVAFAAQKALQRQNPAPPPPQGTVVGDMMQQLSARQQGVAGLPNPVMDNAQYAGGGIVAFAGGDMVGNPHEDDYLPRNGRSSGAGPRVATEADIGNYKAELEELERRAAAGKATEQELGRLAKLKNAAKSGWQGLKAAATEDISVGQGLKSLAGKGATAAGWAGNVARHSVIPSALFASADALSEQDEVPIEALRAIYAGREKEYFDAIRDGKPIPAEFTDAQSSAWGDVGNRLHAALGKTTNMLSFGLADTDPYAIYNRMRAEYADAAKNTPAPAAPPVPLPGLENYQDPLLAELQGLPALAAGPNMGNFRKQMEQYLTQAQEGVPTKPKTMDEAVEARHKINEKYGVYAPITAAEARIAKRRAKAEEEGNKSILTELGLAFLTKGVMAAGEGKDTLSAMAFAIDDGAKNYKERKDRTDAILDKLDDAQSAVDAQKAAIASGEISGADADIRRDEDRINNAKDKALNIRISMLTTELQMADSAANRRLQTAIQMIRDKASLEEKNQLGRYVRRWEDLKSKGPKFKAQADAAKNELVEFLKTTSLEYMIGEQRGATAVALAEARNNLKIGGGQGAAGAETGGSGWGYEEVQ